MEQQGCQKLGTKASKSRDKNFTTPYCLNYHKSDCLCWAIKEIERPVN